MSTTTADASSTADLVTAYGRRVTAAYATHHTVVSPLGIYLLLALLAPAADHAARERLEAELGTTAADAAARLASMLAEPHPAVRAAIAVWRREAFVTEAFTAYAASLPPLVDLDEMPTQAGADRWAVERTNGLIERFPIEIDDRTAIVLASALATDVSWETPFELADAEMLGGALGAALAVRHSHALCAAKKHTQAIVTTEAAGLVAAHVARAATGLRVASVIAGPDVPPDRAHAAAAEVGAADIAGTLDDMRVDLFDLPLGDGHAWSLVERERQVRGFSVAPRTETYTTYLPAWRSTGDHDLAAAPGVADALQTMESYVRPQADPAGSEARQSAVAEYTRYGFKAAAVTAFGVRATAMPSEHRVLEREATVRFNRPYAVVALADSHAVVDGVRVDLERPAWVGVPVFNAWVAEAVDADVARPDAS